VQIGQFHNASCTTHFPHHCRQKSAFYGCVGQLDTPPLHAPRGRSNLYRFSPPEEYKSHEGLGACVCVCTTCTNTHTTHPTTRSHLGFLLKLGCTELTNPNCTTCTTPGLFRAIAGKSGLYNAPNGPSSPPRTTRPGAKAAKKRPWHGFAGAAHRSGRATAAARSTEHAKEKATQ